MNSPTTIGRIPLDRRAVLRLLGDQPDHPQDDEARDRAARRAPGQHPERREEQQQDHQHAGHQQRLVLVADQLDRVLGDLAGRQPDDELGDVGDRVAAQAQQGGGQETGRQTCDTGEHAGERPEPS